MKIFIWGVGRVTESIISNLKKVDIIGYIETRKSRDIYRGKIVYELTEVNDDYDAILVANRYGKEIYNYCNKLKVEMDKFCFLYPVSEYMNVERNLAIAKQVLKPDLYEYVCTKFKQLERDWVSEDAILYSKINNRLTMQIRKEYNLPIYTDKIAKAGKIDSYFWQDLWAARKIYKNNPKHHYDIGSRVDGFISHLLTFREDIYLIDIRQLDREVDGLNFIREDATNLDGIEDDSIESISALCSLEHFGLGRYGDKIDPEASYKCFKAIYKKVKEGGDIYISVPVGWEHVEFNAHRVFFASTIVEAFKECKLVEYSCTANGFIEYNVNIHKYDEDRGIGGGRFGLFHFRKGQ